MSVSIVSSYWKRRRTKLLNYIVFINIIINYIISSSPGTYNNHKQNKVNKQNKRILHISVNNSKHWSHHNTTQIAKQCLLYSALSSSIDGEVIRMKSNQCLLYNALSSSIDDEVIRMKTNQCLLYSALSSPIDAEVFRIKSNH